MDQGGVGPPPGDVARDVGEPRQQDQAHRQRQPAGEAAVGGQHLVEQEAPRQQRRQHRGAGRPGERQGDDRQPPVLAGRHHGEQPRQHAAGGRRGRLGAGARLRQLRRGRGTRRRGLLPAGRRVRFLPQHAIGGTYELLRRGRPRAGVAGQQQHAAGAPRGQPPAAQVAMRGEGLEFGPRQHGDRPAADQRQAGRPRRQPFSGQAALPADVGGEGHGHAKARLSALHTRGDVGRQGHGSTESIARRDARSTPGSLAQPGAARSTASQPPNEPPAAAGGAMRLHDAPENGAARGRTGQPTGSASRRREWPGGRARRASPLPMSRPAAPPPARRGSGAGRPR